jgi:hypothetical protein
MSVNKLTYLLHLRVFSFIFADYPGFRLSGKAYFPTNPDNRESAVLLTLFSVNSPQFFRPKFPKMGGRKGWEGIMGR